jgi:hypothetical protein
MKFRDHNDSRWIILERISSSVSSYVLFYLTAFDLARCSPSMPGSRFSDVVLAATAIGALDYPSVIAQN